MRRIVLILAVFSTAWSCSPGTSSESASSSEASLPETETEAAQETSPPTEEVNAVPAATTETTSEPNQPEEAPAQAPPATTPVEAILPSTPGDYDVVEARCGDGEVEMAGLGSIKFTKAQEMQGLEGYYMFSQFTLEDDGEVLYEGALEGAGNYYANCMNGNPGIGAFVFHETTFILIPRTQGSDDLPPINLVLMLRDGEINTAHTTNTFFDPTNDTFVVGHVKAILYELQALEGVKL
ncbi:MAG: hypothetical protein AAFQ98_26210 [Bacteroidota bacterium]